MHKDVLDAPGTLCSKALVFHSEEDMLLARQRLRQWCLEGRFKEHRADETDKTNSHKFCEPRTLVLQSLDEQGQALVSAMNDPDWILGAGGNHEGV